MWQYNKFVLKGELAGDAEIHRFAEHSVARFRLTVFEKEKYNGKTRLVRAQVPVEIWRPNSNCAFFEKFTKGRRTVVAGIFRPKQWIDAAGVEHGRVILVAEKIYGFSEECYCDGAPVKDLE